MIKEFFLKQSRLLRGHTYHIYNRGNNRGRIFFELENYTYFMRLYKKYIAAIAELFAYCLLPNHFHLLLRIKDQGEFKDSRDGFVSAIFGTFLGTYVKAVNKRYKRSGALFEGRYQRVVIGSENQLFNTLVYIHQNPQKHGYVSSFQSWPYSSYQYYITRDPGDLVSPSLFYNPLLYNSIMELHKTII